MENTLGLFFYEQNVTSVSGLFSVDLDFLKHFCIFSYLILLCSVLSVARF
jgi:hypothetical protein